MLDELTLNKFAGEHLVYLGREISVSSNVAFHHVLQTVCLMVGSLSCARIEQDIFEVWRQFITIPDPKMIKPVPPEKQPFQVQRSKNMVETREPLRHAAIVRKFCFESELLVKASSV